MSKKLDKLFKSVFPASKESNTEVNFFRVINKFKAEDISNKDIVDSYAKSKETNMLKQRVFKTLSYLSSTFLYLFDGDGFNLILVSKKTYKYSEFYSNPDYWFQPNKFIVRVVFQNNLLNSKNAKMGKTINII